MIKYIYFFEFFESFQQIRKHFGVFGVFCTISLILYGNMVQNVVLRLFEIFEKLPKMSQKCEQFSYRPFFLRFVGINGSLIYNNKKYSFDFDFPPKVFDFLKMYFGCGLYYKWLF